MSLLLLLGAASATPSPALPLIKLRGNPTVVVKVLAERPHGVGSPHYNDAGASCSDATDGVIGAKGVPHVGMYPQMTVSGEVVNLMRVVRAIRV